MKDIEVVLNDFLVKGIRLDLNQVSFIEEFLELDSKYKPPNFFFKNNLINSIYLWGPVGRGKTLLLKAICDSFFPESGKFHYLEFMQLIHSELSNFKGTSDPLKKVVKNLVRNYKIIFIDEFQIEDIADAMIIGMLIEFIVSSGTRLFISSNTHPDDLYKDGLQRSKFLKTIGFINKYFLIHHLDGPNDYRLSEIADFDISAEDRNHDKSVKKFLERTFSKGVLNKKSFSVSNRKFDCLGASDKILWISFDDFFSLPCASKDFIEIVNKYEWVFINNFHFCNDDCIDKVRRFISFIDIAYQEKQKLKLFCDSELIHNLYTGDILHSLWFRTESRLNHIATKKYLQNLKKN